MFRFSIHKSCLWHYVSFAFALLLMVMVRTLVMVRTVEIQVPVSFPKQAGNLPKEPLLPKGSEV